MELVFARENHFGRSSMLEGGAKNSRPFIVICPALAFFSEKVAQTFLYEFSVMPQVISVTLLGIVTLGTMSGKKMKMTMMT